jgi:GMP synthase (glutamine-hydrolysing)
MQIIGLVFGGKIHKKTEMGFYFENFKSEFLGLGGEQEVYHLHNNFVDFGKMKDFEVICQGNSIPQSVKHKAREIYGVLFHPEVRQKEIVLRFLLK